MPLARVRETAGLAWEWAWRPMLAREGWCEGVAHNLQRVCQRLLKDGQHITGMSSSCRSCLWWSSQPKSWPMLVSSACEVVRE